VSSKESTQRFEQAPLKVNNNFGNLVTQDDETLSNRSAATKVSSNGNASNDKKLRPHMFGKCVVLSSPFGSASK
jgi:hypothetical protein